MRRLITVILVSLCAHNASAEPIMLPALIALTESGKAFGTVELDGYTLAVEERNARGGVNGTPVQLVVEDTKTNSMATVTAFQRLALRHPPIILGPTWLDTFISVSPIAQKQKILLISPSASAELLTGENSWPLSTYYNSTREADYLIESLHAEGKKNITVLYEQEPFAEMMLKLLTESATKRGVPLREEIGIPGGETDFRTKLTVLRKTPPDALIILVWDERSLLSLFKQLRVITPSLFLASVHDAVGWIVKPEFIPVIKQLMYVYFTVENKNFIDRFTHRFGYEPRLTASTAYDAANIALTTLANPQISDGEKARDFITSTPFSSATFGNITVPQHGNIVSDKGLAIGKFIAP